MPNDLTIYLIVSIIVSAILLVPAIDTAESLKESKLRLPLKILIAILVAIIITPAGIAFVVVLLVAWYLLICINIAILLIVRPIQHVIFQVHKPYPFFEVPYHSYK